MFKPTRRVFSLTCIAFLLVMFVISPFTANACEEEPQTLLSLYLQSKLIVVAEIEGSKAGERLNEDEYGYGSNTTTTLRITKTFKGSPEIKTVSFTSYTYQPKMTVDSPVETFQDYSANPENIVEVEKIKVGDKYMFFLTKYGDDKGFSLIDYSSAIKNIEGNNVYEKSIVELNEIVKLKQGQKERLLEWLVKSIEEPRTREDGIRDVSEGLYSYLEDSENKITEEAKPFVFDDKFDLYSSKISKSLSDSQKYRISAVLYPILQESWFADKPKYVQYGISEILSFIDKPRLGIYAYNMFKSVDNDDFQRKNVIMQFLVGVADDTTLSKIYYEINDIEYELKSKEAKTADKIKTKLELKNTLLKTFDTQFEQILSKNFEATK